MYSNKVDYKQFVNEIAENLEGVLTRSKLNNNLKNVDWYIDVIRDKKIKLLLSDLSIKRSNLIMFFEKEDIYHAAMIVGSKSGIISKKISILIAMKSLENLAKLSATLSEETSNKSKNNKNNK